MDSHRKPGAPVERTLLVAKVEVSAHYLGLETDLSANEFMGGAISGQGFVHLESFRLEDGMPTWRYAIGDALLETRIFMAPEANTSYLRIELLRATAPLRVTLKPLVTYRDYHSQGRGAQPLQLETAPGECRVQAFPARVPIGCPSPRESSHPRPFGIGTSCIAWKPSAASMRLRIC
jgi:hypothetical protein